MIRSGPALLSRLSRVGGHSSKGRAGQCGLPWRAFSAVARGVSSLPRPQEWSSLAALRATVKRTANVTVRQSVRCGFAAAAVPFGSLTLSMGPMASYVSRPIGSGFQMPLRRVPSDGSTLLIFHNYENVVLRWLNILAWVFLGGGLVAAINYAVVGGIACLTVVGIPYGLQMFRLGHFCLQPFGKEVYQVRSSTTGLRATTIAFLPFSLMIATMHLVAAGLNACSIVGLSFAEEHLRLAVISASPLTKAVGKYRGGDLLYDSAVAVRDNATALLKSA